MQQIRVITSAVLLALCLTGVPHLRAATVNVDCDAGAGIGASLGSVKPGDVILVQGTCRENLLIQSEVLRLTLDGQGRTTIDAPDARRPAVQVLGREVTVKGFTVTGGTFGIAINRGATGTIDRNTVRNAAISGLEVSHNGFARIVTTPSNEISRKAFSSWAARRPRSVSSARTTRFRVRMSSRTMAGMASRCCAAPPPASLATRSAVTAATG